jgi:hypothetical protein
VEGAVIAIESIEQIRQRVRGVHFTPRFRRFDLAAEIIGQAKKPEGTT